MSELLAKVAELLNAPESLVQRSAEARAEASGRTVDEVLQSWAGGESVASATPSAETPVEEAPPVEESKVPTIKQEVDDSAEVKVSTYGKELKTDQLDKRNDSEIVLSTEVLVEEENVEAKKESSLGFVTGVMSVVIFTFLFAYSIPKQQSEDLVLQSLNNTVQVSEEILQGAIIYNQLNCQSCHTQNVRILIPDSQNGKVLKNKFANRNIILNTGLLRLAPDLSNMASRQPTNDKKWLEVYLTDPASIKDEIPHPSINFLNDQDLDYLITYLLSLSSTNE